MPLPAALAARLAKRGLLNTKPVAPEPEEEVIAEDYDEPSKSTFGTGCKSMVPGCPNKINIYHDCNDYCMKQWGLGEQTPSDSIQKKYQRLLKKYPLPENWRDVWEPGLCRYYFWNTTTDEVSWFPPGAPKFKATLPVPKLKAMKREEDILASIDSSGMESSNSSDEDSEDDSDSDAGSETNKPSNSGRVSSGFRPQSDRFRGRQVVKRNDLDPMDPASYSETCPRGKWSDGLETKSAGQSGADPTVSGPTYQMRPYPSPGSVLKSNKKSKTDE